MYNSLGGEVEEGKSRQPFETSDHVDKNESEKCESERDGSESTLKGLIDSRNEERGSGHRPVRHQALIRRCYFASMVSK